MSENEYTETFDPPEISDEDIQGLIDGGEAPSYHPILEVWRKVLEPAAEEMQGPITPQWANRMVQAYPEMSYAAMPELQSRYFGKILELASILETVIESDEDCLKPTTPEEDVEHNAQHYRDLLMHWQILFLTWEQDWDCTDEHAAVEIAAISEVHKAFFGQTGITAFLDNIGFPYTEADQAELAEALQAVKEGR